MWRILSEFWLDAVFLVDMIRIFLTPYQNANGKLVTKKSRIALKYLRGWFFLDAYAFFPLGLLRFLSDWKQGSSTDK